MRLLLVLLLVTAAGASVLEDPAGDVKVEVYGVGVGGNAAAADLRWLDIEESADSLVLRLGVAGDPLLPAGAQMDGAEMWITFRHGGNAFVIHLGRDTDGRSFAGLYALDLPGPTPRLLQQLEHSVDKTIAVVLPRGLIRDEQGAPPMHGARLEHLRVLAQAHLRVDGPNPERGFFCCASAVALRDRMPDEASGTYAFKHGGPATDGSLAVHLGRPYQATNGGGDLRFDVVLANTGAASLTPDLILDDAPAWRFDLPPAITLAPGESASLPLVVRLPWAHQHGGTHEFTLRAQADGAVATTPMGVHVLAVPTPSGHHPTLYLQGRTDSTQWDPALEALGYAPGMLFMNTLPGPDVRADSTASSFGGTEARWSICLAPGPALDMDFDLERAGLLRVALSSGRSYGEVTLGGRLVLYGPGAATDPCDADVLDGRRDATVLADVGPVATTLEGVTPVEATVMARPESDHVRHVAGSMLLLELRASFTVPDSQGPGPLVLEPGGELRLPLNELSVASPEAVQQTPAPSPEGPMQKSPAWLPAALVLVLLARRRCR